MMQWVERVDIPFVFGLRKTSYWPKNGLRKNLTAPKLKNFGGWGGGVHAPRPHVAFLRMHYKPDHFKSDGHGAADPNKFALLLKC